MDISKIRQEVKYLLFDLDGTLVSDERKLAPDHHQIPELLQSLGLQHSIITGRPHYMMMQEIEQVKPTLPIVGANGALIMKGNEIVWSQTMNQDHALKFMNYLIETKTNFYLYTAQQIYTHPDSFPHVDRWREIVSNLEPRYRWKISSLNEFDPAQHKIIKFLVNSPDHARIHDYIQQNYPNELSFARSTPSSIDVGDIKVNKGTGLNEIMKILNATPEQFMVFGDGGNDIPMFKVAKYSVALKNAADFVKEQAKFVTDLDNNASGVYHFIKKIWG